MYQGDTVTFSVETGGNTNLTFQWTFNGVPIPGATNNSYTIDYVQYSDPGTFAVIISDGTNTVISTAATLNVRTAAGDIYLMPIVGPRQSYTFKNGVTYYIGSPVQLYGDTVIEAGAVLKFDWEYNSSLVVMGTLTCKTTPYFPAILTSIDDDAAGEQLYFSSGYPQTAENGAPYLDLSWAKSNSISNLRFCFADWGVTTPATSRRLDVWDCQFVLCNYGVVNLVDGSGATDSLHNVLFSACGAAVGASSNSAAIEGEQVTAYVDDFCLADSTPSRIALTNSIVWGNSPTASSLSTVNVAFNPNDTNFQSSGLGHYYLAANSPLHRGGTANISPRLQGELQGKTTCPPIDIAVYTTLSGEMTLAPQAPRYTNGPPDIGYYYDALDYTVATMILTGGSITVLPGTVIGTRNQVIPNDTGDFYTVIGFWIEQGSSFVSHGLPAKPIIYTHTKFVQEMPDTDFSQYQTYVSAQYEAWFPGMVSFVPDFEPDGINSAAPTLDFRFSQFYMTAVDYHFWGGYDEYNFLTTSPDSTVYFNLRDCALKGGRINFGKVVNRGFTGTGKVVWDNTSFENVNINLDTRLV